MKILIDIDKLLTEAMPMQMQMPIMSAPQQVMTPALMAKIQQNRKLTYTEFKKAQAARMAPGVLGMPRSMEMRLFTQFNQIRR